MKGSGRQVAEQAVDFDGDEYAKPAAAVAAAEEESDAPHSQRRGEFEGDEVDHQRGARALGPVPLGGSLLTDEMSEG